MFPKIKNFFKDYFNPNPFYFAFALSFFSLVTTYIAEDGLWEKSVTSYGIFTVALGALIRVVVGTISTGSIFWVILILLSKVKNKSN
jgi:hypothetical protein